MEGTSGQGKLGDWRKSYQPQRRDVEVSRVAVFRIEKVLRYLAVSQKDHPTGKKGRTSSETVLPNIK